MCMFSRPSGVTFTVVNFEISEDQIRSTATSATLGKSHTQGANALVIQILQLKTAATKRRPKNEAKDSLASQLPVLRQEKN